MPRYTKQKDGRYVTNISTGQYTAQGKLITKRVYARNIAELERKVLAMKLELAGGLDILSGDLKFEKYADRWFETYKCNKSIQTQNMYSNILKKHMEILNPLPIKDIRTTHVQKQVNTVSDKPRTAELIQLTCRQIFQSAINDRIITINPCSNISLPRKKKSDRRAFTKAEKEAIKSAEFNPEEKAFISILYYCGMRPAEVYALTWSDIDLKNEVISVNKSLNFLGQKPLIAPPKTDESVRTIEIHKNLVRILKEYRVVNRQLLLFGLPNGNYKTLSSYQTLFKHCKAKIEDSLGHKTDITAYYFRHSFCTSLYYSGVSMKEAVRLMGHADSKMIMKVYAHLDSEKENTREKLNSINF